MDSAPQLNGHVARDRHDRRADLLLDALRAALARPGEHRLHRAGKLAGLFPSRVGPAAEAALIAVREGYLEKTHTEYRGRVECDWVRLTPKGVEYVHSHDSPRAVLVELRDTLAATRDGVPLWLDTIRNEFAAFAARTAEQLARFTERLDALSERVEEALRRADAIGPSLSDDMRKLVPWAMDALTYVDHRRASGAVTECPLPELFAAVCEKHEGLSLPMFHDGLRRLRDAGALRLLPAMGVDIREPEYALPDAAGVFYYAKR